MLFTTGPGLQHRLLHHHGACAPAPSPPSPQGLHSSTTSSITTEPAIQAPAPPPPSLFKIPPKCLILQKPAASLFQHSAYLHCFGERLRETVLSLDVYWKKKEHFNCGNSSLTSLQNASVSCSMVSDPPMPRSLNHCCNCQQGPVPHAQFLTYVEDLNTNLLHYISSKQSFDLTRKYL